MARAKIGMSSAAAVSLLLILQLIAPNFVAACEDGKCAKPGCQAPATPSESGKGDQSAKPADPAGNESTSHLPGLSAPQVSTNPIPLKVGEGKTECSDAHHKVTCVGPHAACPESEKVIETLKALAAAYTEGNFDELAKFMDDGVTTFDESSHKLIVGKEAVVTDIKKRWELAHNEDAPVLSYTINNPYAQVTGDRAVVTFEAIKTVGGKHPETLVSHCTDIFVKRDDGWKKLHYRLCWKKAKAHT